MNQSVDLFVITGTRGHDFIGGNDYHNLKLGKIFNVVVDKLKNRNENV